MLAKHPEYEIVAEVNDDFDGAKALAVTQDLLTRFPEGELDVIVMQGPEGVAAATSRTRMAARRSSSSVGDYPADVRQAIIDGLSSARSTRIRTRRPTRGCTWRGSTSTARRSEIPKPYFLELPIITIENAEATPPAWGCAPSAPGAGRDRQHGLRFGVLHSSAPLKDRHGG